MLYRAIEYNSGREHKGGIWIVPRSTSFSAPTSACCTASTTCSTGCMSVPQSASRACGPARQVRDGHAPLRGHKGITGTLTVTTRLDAESAEGKGGMVRIGAVHYNTVEEIRRLGEALRAMA